jgi:hypothetical protein
MFHVEHFSCIVRNLAQIAATRRAHPRPPPAPAAVSWRLVAKRQVVIVKTIDPADEDEGAGLPALGDLPELLGWLARFNTAPDGGQAGANAEAMGLLKLHGPGMTIELMAPGGQDVRQLMVNMTDDDFAFPVLVRMCRMHRWTMLDPASGQRLRF